MEVVGSPGSLGKGPVLNGHYLRGLEPFYCSGFVRVGSEFVFLHVD